MTIKKWDFVKILKGDREQWKAWVEDINHESCIVKTIDWNQYSVLYKNLEILKMKDYPRYIKDLKVWDVLETKDWLRAKITHITDKEIITTKRGEMFWMERIARTKSKFQESFAQQERKIAGKNITLTAKDIVDTMWNSIIEWVNDDNVKIDTVAIWDLLIDLRTMGKRMVVYKTKKYIFLGGISDEKIDKIIKDYGTHEVYMTTYQKLKKFFIKYTWDIYFTKQEFQDIIDRWDFVLSLN